MSSRGYEILSALRRDSILSLLKKNERVDGRGLDEIRRVEIQTGLIGKAEGSALVKLGDTKVVAGIKAGIGSPFPDTPDRGVQIVNAELIPLASPFFEAGPPGEEGVEIARVVDRGLRSAGAISLDKLSIIPGRKVWTVFIDIYPLDHYGNLIDASGLAAVSAILTTTINRVEVQGEDVYTVEEKMPLPVGNIPVFITVAKIGDKLLVDPNYEEELVMDARITFAIDEEGNICCIQKGGTGGLTYDEAIQAKNLAIKASTQLRKSLPQPKNI